jgi:membrane-bound PQQ-dependent dehydrogenase (glucose/quinate/shikimate family)
MNTNVTPGRPLLSSLILLVAGLGLLPGGVKLLMLGGSPYYIVAALGLSAAGVLLLGRSVWGFRLYALTLIGTVAWALWEVGPVFWLLVPRIGTVAALGLVFLLPGARAVSFPAVTPSGWRKVWVGAGVLIAAIVVAVGVACLPPTGGGQDLSTVKAGGAATDWPHYGNDRGGSRFADVDQITPANVGALEVAWTYRTGDMPAAAELPPMMFEFENTPLKVGDTLYVCTGHNIVIALDAETGKERWRHDPKVKAGDNLIFDCRGVAYDAPAAAGATACPRRIYAATIDARLLAINADTGEPCADFGTNGEVSLLEHMGDFTEKYYFTTRPYTTSPPLVVNGNVVVGGQVIDNFGTNVASGVIRSFDAVTGKLRWAWDMGAPDRIGPPADGERYTPGTPNAWSMMSADAELGLIYAPLGNPGPDHFGGRRRPFDEKYGSSVVALDAETGRVKWSFQSVHHDLWDYDNPAQPTLVDLPRPALVLPTKSGQVFVLDRRDGTPILPVTERPAPQGAVAGDFTSPTQPWSAINLMGPPLTEKDMWGVTPYDQLYCRVRFKEMRYEGPYTPPGLQGSIFHPGAMGTVGWGGVGIDVKNKRVVVPTSSTTFWMRLLRRDQHDIASLKTATPTSAPVTPRGAVKEGREDFWLPMHGTPYMVYMRPFMGPLWTPCNAPPWGHIAAYDLVTGKQVWKTETGTARDTGPWKIPIGLALPMAVPSQGGLIVTSGGLVFHAGTLDNYLRAYDAATGKELWRGRLPAGGQATPMSYRGKDGRQYVVIAAGGHGGLFTTPGDYVIAFALPKTE